MEDHLPCTEPDLARRDRPPGDRLLDGQGRHGEQEGGGEQPRDPSPAESHDKSPYPSSRSTHPNIKQREDDSEAIRGGVELMTFEPVHRLGYLRQSRKTRLRGGGNLGMLILGNMG